MADNALLPALLPIVLQGIHYFNYFMIGKEKHRQREIMPLLLFAYTGCCKLNYTRGRQDWGSGGENEEAGALQSLMPAGQVSAPSPPLTSLWPKHPSSRAGITTPCFSIKGAEAQRG